MERSSFAKALARLIAAGFDRVLRCEAVVVERREGRQRKIRCTVTGERAYEPHEHVWEEPKSP